MQVANQVFFIVFSLLSFAVFLISLTFYRKDKSDSSIVYWCLSVALFSLTGLCFGIAIWTHTFLMTIANFSVISSKLCLSILYCSWNHKKFTSKQIFLLIFSVVLVVGVYEFLREGQNTYIQRVVLVGLPQEIFLIWQLFSLHKFQRNHKNNYISALFLLTFIHLAGIITRAIWVAYFSNQLNGYLHVSDILSLSLLWLNFGSIFLIYVVLAGFYLDRQYRNKEIIRSKLNQSESEKIAIKNLLEEKERLAYELIKVNKSVTAGALTASLAHELNQPIGASRIDLYSLKKLLQEQNLYTNEAKELLERMEFDNQRSGGIVETLHSIFKQDRPVVESVPVSELVQSTVDLAMREMKLNDVAIDINIPNELVINVGRVEMQQVLLNILNNAIHALKELDTPNAKSIWITARKTDANAIEIMVQDNGPGVDPAIANNIFTLFLTKKKSGLGVGLWLCQYILSRYGAEISYRPRAGGGSAFIILMKDSQ